MGFYKLFTRFLTFTLQAVFALSVHNADARTIVTDKETGTPLPLASIFSNDGKLVATTSETGEVPELQANYYPVSVRFIGYEPVTISSPGIENISMTAVEYELPELTVGTENHNFLHLTAYVREYCTIEVPSDSSWISFTEKIVDFMIPLNKKKSRFKGWDKSRVLKATNIMGHGDSIKVDYKLEKDFLNPLKIAAKMHVPAKIKNGQAQKATIMGKYSPKTTWYAIGDGYHIVTDGLADYQNHIYSPNAAKFLGLTMDATKAESTMLFENVKGQDISAEDLAAASMNIEIVGKGKVFKWMFNAKEPIIMDIYSEIYVIDREYLTEKEAKESKSNPPSVRLKTPKKIAPMPHAYTELVSKAKAKGKIR